MVVYVYIHYAALISCDNQDPGLASSVASMGCRATYMKALNFILVYASELPSIR